MDPECRRPRTALLLFLGVILLSGCITRSAAGSGEPGPSEAVSEEPETPSYTVVFRSGGEILSSQTVEEGALPEIPAPENVRLLGWTDADGVPADPGRPVTADAEYTARTRPLLKSDRGWLYPRETGFLAPEQPFTCGDALAAAETLLADPDDLALISGGWADRADEPISREDFRTLLYALFDETEADAAFVGVYSDIFNRVTRADAARCLFPLLGSSAAEEVYYPDLPPDRPAFAELCAAAAEGVLDRDALVEKTQDGFVWFDGYLYHVDEDGYFLSDETYDGLYFNIHGRFTSGTDELDDYVAQTISLLTSESQTRTEKLRSVYLYVKNNLEYLVRNYYPSGANDWAVAEALTMYRTGRGNCYNYAGVFWSLARGLGYNAVTFSGTIGVEFQLHAWTEIIIDGEYFICDPEIEMNYWYLAELNHDNSMYTDNFMMPRSRAGNWYYRSEGRQ